MDVNASVYYKSLWRAVGLDSTSLTYNYITSCSCLMHGLLRQGCQALTWHPRISSGRQPAWVLVFRHRSNVSLFLECSWFRNTGAVPFPWPFCLWGTRQISLFLCITVEKSSFSLWAWNSHLFRNLHLVRISVLPSLLPGALRLLSWCS